MRRARQWICICICLLIFSSCSKEPKVNEIIEEDNVEVNDLNKDESELVEDNIKEDAKDSEVSKEDIEASSEADIKDQVADEEIAIKDKSLLISELKSDSWIQAKTIFLAKDESFIIYKKWLKEIDSEEFELYIWDFESEPKLIEEAVGLVQGFDVSLDETNILIHMGTAMTTKDLVYNIKKASVVIELESVEDLSWSVDGKGIVGKKIVYTEEESLNGFNEVLIYWDPTLAKAIDVMPGKYGISFDHIKGDESDIKLEVVYPNGETKDLMISYELIKNKSYPELYSLDPYNYMKAMIDSENESRYENSYITDNYIIYSDAIEDTLSMWTPEEGIILLDKDKGIYTDFQVSPNERYIGVTAGTSVARELLIVDSIGKSLIYETGLVYDALYWSLDSQYLAFNILSDIVINTELEVDVTMDVAVVRLDELVGRRVAFGTSDYYLLVEGFNDNGLAVYKADREFLKTSEDTISFEELINAWSTFKNLKEEEKDSFDFVEVNYENEYATNRINDGISEVDAYYLKKGFETLIPEGFLPVASTIDQYNVDEGFLSLVFTYKYRNDQGAEVYLYDSLTYHTDDGVLIGFDTMFKAEEIENVFSRMLVDQVNISEIDLIKDFDGYNESAKFYFVEDGLIVYYKAGLFTDMSMGPLYIKLQWEDLKGVIDRSSLVY